MSYETQEVSFNQKNNKLGKEEKEPMIDEEIDLSNHIVTEVGPRKYKLLGLIYKRKDNYLLGNPKNYIAYVKNMNSDFLWRMCSDGKETECSLREIIGNNMKLTTAFYIGLKD